MIHNKKFTIFKHPIQIGHSNYVCIPRKKCLLNKDIMYKFEIIISEVE
jgi:hypothetical protein